MSSCHYCGLPVNAKGQSDPVYCCYGCRFAEHITGARGEEGTNRATLARLGIAIFFTMNVIAFSMALWVQDHEGARGEALADSLWGLLRYLCLLFSLPVVYLLGVPLLESSFESLSARRITMDTLLFVGVLSSLLYSIWSAFTEAGHVYFEVACAILVLVTLGKWLEAEGKRKTTEALEGLARLLPEQVRIMRSGGEVSIPSKELTIGDQFRILAGEVIPADGTIATGVSGVDQQILTGESRAVLKKAGDRVFAGTHCIDGDLIIEATTTFQGGSLQRLIEQVRQAARTKGRYERLADKVSAAFVPVIMIIAASTFAYHAAEVDFGFGLRAALGVLVIACPCALGLATPMATWAAMGAAAGHQVVFQSCDALEKLAEVRSIRFDKTGTLTTGKPEVIDTVFRGDAALGVAKALSSRSIHPLAAAVFASIKIDEPVAVEETRTVSGMGIEARTKKSMVRLGSLSFLQKGEYRLNDPSLKFAYASAVNAGHSVVCLGIAGELRGLFVCTEAMRPESQPAIYALKEQGYELAVLTGDHRQRGLAIEKELGIPVLAELLPEDKVKAIETARAAGHSVAMVGDGINDAPALAHADVGIALGCGADLSRSTADVCLLSSDLMRLPWTLSLARRTAKIIRENLIWAFSYNTLAIGLAVTGRLNPVIAAVAMLVSSFLVIGNSLRLTRSELVPLGLEGADERHLQEEEVDKTSSSERWNARSPVKSPLGVSSGN